MASVVPQESDGLKARVQRTVRGGATMSPQENPRPDLPDFWEIVKKDLVLPAVRGPFVACLITYMGYPSFKAWWQSHLARGGTEASAFSKSISAMHVSLYLSMFAFYEIGAQTEWMQQFKLARNKAQEPTWKMKAKTIAEFLVSNLLTWLFLLPIAHEKVFKRFGMGNGASPLPSFTKMFFTYMAATVGNKLLFAVAHRILHWGPLYRAIHKKHHEYVGTISIAAENAHPFEHITANLIPTLAGTTLFGAHPLMQFIWIMWRLQQTYEGHSGYAFYGTWLHNIGMTNADASMFHDHHHMENKGNFGTEFTDYLFGTMDHWVKHGRYEGYLNRVKEMAAKAEKEELLSQ